MKRSIATGGSDGGSDGSSGGGSGGEGQARKSNQGHMKVRAPNPP